MSVGGMARPRRALADPRSGGRNYGMPLRALRGATTVAADDPSLLADATQELLRALLERNALERSQLVSAFFTSTGDLVSAYPAQAARDMGWTHVPMLCAAELPVRGALPRCIRVLLHVDVSDAGFVPRHAYLRDAASLRGDLEDPLA
jgi:chorismate mutase